MMRPHSVCLPALLVVWSGWVPQPTAAQTNGPNLNVAPVYEGWERNADGSFDLVFGYMNRSWDDAIELPVGVGNSLEPGGPDRGQPTYFYPRRNRFVFRVRVPSHFGDKELVWTLTSRGETERAYGTLKPDYVIDDTVLMANFGAGGALGYRPDMAGNRAPTLELKGNTSHTVSVGESLALTAIAGDDGKPRPRSMPAILGGSRMLPDNATGLRLTWFVYRGSGDVVFDPPQPKVWEDTRDGANSPWSAGWKTPPIPADNTWIVNATFRTPGRYVLRCLAHDGGLTAHQDVTVTVRP